MIRTSIEKPIYKEKLRIRFYNELNELTKGFIEIKKKYDGIVYKRRISMPYDKLINDIKNNFITEESQIANEINYCLKYYNIKPKIQLTYYRHAYVAQDNLRITIDSFIKYKNKDIYNFESDGISLNDDIYLLEIKTQIGLPRWLLDFFFENNITKTSFSKYGEVYKKISFK